jgi:hypothetical protein
MSDTKLTRCAENFPAGRLSHRQAVVISSVCSSRRVLRGSLDRRRRQGFVSTAVRLGLGFKISFNVRHPPLLSGVSTRRVRVKSLMNTPTDARTRAAVHGPIDPTVLVALMATCQIVAWTLAPALTQSALPLDVVEGYMWGREWVIATYKHPAMPSWVLEIARLATGAVGWPAYLVSQLFVATTFIFVYLLGRDLLGPERAAAGTRCSPASPFMRGRRPNSITTLLKCRLGPRCPGLCGARWSGGVSLGGRLPVR